jgi:hypothetical protein
MLKYVRISGPTQFIGNCIQNDVLNYRADRGRKMHIGAAHCMVYKVLLYNL